MGLTHINILNTFKSKPHSRHVVRKTFVKSSEKAVWDSWICFGIIPDYFCYLDIMDTVILNKVHVPHF